MSKTSIKLFIDTKKNKVLFAEAGKQFVDFLFNLFALPVGTVVSLLATENMVGSLGNLYESVESLNLAYMLPNADKNFILKPNLTHCSMSYFCTDPSIKCPACNCYLGRAKSWVAQKVTSFRCECSAVGFVRSQATYMVMDDLKVKPISTISNITTLLQKFNIKDVGLLEEKVVDFTGAEGLKLLEESLSSQCVQTNVFLCGSSA